MKKIILSSICGILITFQGISKENASPGFRNSPPSGNDVLASCAASTAQTDLNINNIRTKIFINGDMWWDLVGTAVYEIPNGSGKHSLFAGAIWVGGYDNSGNLRVAAQTYRQSGSDFWPGPIDTNTTDVGTEICTKFDRHYVLTRDEVQQTISNFNASAGGYPPGYEPFKDMKEYPGNGDDPENGAGPGYTKYLAPFYDNDNDGRYDWTQGDYPWYEFNSPTPICDDRLLGDQTLWWVFNDVGNIHSETDSQNPIGLEIQAQAFAFKTNDEINNMSFYKYKIINRNTTTNINQCYFGAWCDPDLGNYLDDYVGCDVGRGFGYCYNGDGNDEGIAGYGFNPPAVGIDFFQGPTADLNDNIDNDRDSCNDCSFVLNSQGQIDTISDSILPEQIIMSKFVYYNNDNDPISGNPNGAEDYYGYLKGLWRNGNTMTYGGNGYGGGPGATTDSCNFMFPGDSDPNHWGTNGVPEADWDEVTAGNEPADRRFIQSSGPFTLLPGAVNYITTGAVWARATNGGPLASVRLVRQADDYAQALFNNCFKVVDGPDAPDVAIRELDKELIFSIDNGSLSNNYKELYAEIDPNTVNVSYYTFQGYQIYQTSDPFVTVADAHNPDKARLVLQCDIKDGIAQIVNNYFDLTTQGWSPLEEVNGADNGLKHTFRVTTDLFASGDPTLINHKTYYFLAVAYAYNAEESADDPYFPTGRNQPFKSGRKNVKIYTAIPHITDPENNGTVLSTVYGEGPEITRLEGRGNGHVQGSDRLSLDLKRDSEYNKLFTAPYFINHPTYTRARGPIDVRVYDPVKVQGGTFDLWLVRTDDIDSARWVLRNIDQPGAVNDTSLKDVSSPYDQLFPNYGFSINVAQTLHPGVDFNGGAGFIESFVTYENPVQRWWSGVPDFDGYSDLNWIRSGKDAFDYKYTPGTTGEYDGQQIWEKLIGATWAPYKFTSMVDAESGPAFADPNGSTTSTLNKFYFQSGVDVVITNDKSKWSKCVVVEQSYSDTLSVGNIKKSRKRASPSRDQNYNIISGDSGMSYFPGYAVNVETGERLNIAFGENSYYSPANGFAGGTGADMKFNPTSDIYSLDPNGELTLGGRHVIYVFNHRSDTMPAYDEGMTLDSLLGLTGLSGFRMAYANCMWVGYAGLEDGEQLPDFYGTGNQYKNDVTFGLRVTKPYERFKTNQVDINDSVPYYRFATYDLVPKTQNVDQAKSALDLINVVPNPYYAYSSYEKNQLDNRVKIVNLPAKCTISIFSPSGTIIKKIKRDVSSDNSAGSVYDNKSGDTNREASLDWDLKNDTGIPIASGLYIIHVEVPNVGEKTVKFFGVMRPIDLDTF